MPEAVDKVEVFDIGAVTPFDPKKILSKRLHKLDDTSVYVMALNRLQSIPAHTTKHDAFLIALEGEAILTIGKQLIDLKPGKWLILPGEIPHALKALSDFRMLLVKRT